MQENSEKQNYCGNNFFTNKHMKMKKLCNRYTTSLQNSIVRIRIRTYK